MVNNISKWADNDLEKYKAIWIDIISAKITTSYVSAGGGGGGGGGGK